MATSEAPRFFRINVEVASLDAAIEFYSKLLGVKGRRLPGARCYFDCGSVTLSVLEVRKPHPAAKSLYFAVGKLATFFKRAEKLDCLSSEDVHGAPGGAMVLRPWGERSFYAEDPWKNPLCFVEEGTVYTG